MSRVPVAVLLALVVVACSDESQRSSDVGPYPDAAQPDAAPDLSAGEVVSSMGWIPTAAGDDPFGDRPDVVACERGTGWDIELLDMTQTVGVDTGECNYLSLSQPALREVSADEPLQVTLWHFELVGDADAHVGIAVDGDIVWERTIQIPAPSALIAEPINAGRIEAGSSVVFHLHNHGINSWNLVDISPAR